MKCQRQMLGIRWQDRVRNVDVANQTGLPAVMDHIVKRRNSIFRPIARMPCTVPVDQALLSIIIYAARLTCRLAVSQTDHVSRRGLRVVDVGQDVCRIEQLGSKMGLVWNAAKCELVAYSGLIVDDPLLSSFDRVEPSDATWLGAPFIPGTVERLSV